MFTVFTFFKYPANRTESIISTVLLKETLNTLKIMFLIILKGLQDE